MQAIRRGWVHAIWLKPADRRYWGTWVDFPQPVSPATTTTGWSRISSTILSRYWKMGKFFWSLRSLASLVKLCLWVKSRKCSRATRQSEISWLPGPEDLCLLACFDTPKRSSTSRVHTDRLIRYRASYSFGRPRSTVSEEIFLRRSSRLLSSRLVANPDISLFILKLWKRSKKAQNSLCSWLPAWM